MLYFDNAATTFPKPENVRKAVLESFLYYGANPGRSGHDLAMETAKKVFEAREKAADFFGLSSPENLVFTKTVHGQAQSHWFEASLAVNLKKWLKSAKRGMSGGK